MRDLRMAQGTARNLKLEDEMRVNEEILIVQCDCEADAVSIAKNGAALKSKGGATDAVILCLANKTLACKYVETTNALYLTDVEESKNALDNTSDELPSCECSNQNQHAGLLSQLQSDAQAGALPSVMIQAQSHFIVETTYCSIPVQEVQQTLRQQLFIGRDTVQGLSVGSAGMNWSELTAAVMASDKDIIGALQSIRALSWLTIDGHWWALLHETLLLDALEHILLTCIEQKLQLDNFDFAELLAALQAEDNLLAQALTVNEGCIAWHVLRLYGTQNLAFAAWDPDSLTVHAEFPQPEHNVGFDARKVASGCMHAVLCRHCERVHMDPSTGLAVVKVADAQEDWKDVFPSPHLWLECSTFSEVDSAAWSSQLMLDACRGLALLQVRDGCMELRVLFETHLHPTAKKRFETLFSVKATWSKDEIEPYLNIHDSECSNPTELLLRYSRTIRDGTELAPVYCAR